MAVILIPITGTNESGSTGSLTLVEPSTSIALDSCPVLTKTRPVVVDKGVLACVQWTLRDRDGLPIDFSSYVNVSPTSLSESLSSDSDGATVKVRFTNCDDSGEIVEVTGEVVDATAGQVKFCLPASVANVAGIWQFQVGLVGESDSPLVINKGLLSIERGLWGDTSKRSGPPTLAEIRMHIRDTPQENSLLGAYEFDDAEIIAAVVRPVQYWNEQPPPIARHTCQSFPYHYEWLNAIVAELLRTAGHHYMRNKLNSTQGGLAVNDKDKDRLYFELANLYITEWRDFVIRKKISLNYQRGWGTYSSRYSGR